MATNNLINDVPPTVSWLVNLTNPVANVTGDDTPYYIPYNNTVFLKGGVTYNGTIITVPFAGYYYLESHSNMSAIGAGHTNMNYAIYYWTGAAFSYLLLGNQNSPALSRDVNNNAIAQISGIYYLTPTNTLKPRLYVANSTKTIGIAADVGTAYASYFTGNLIEKG